MEFDRAILALEKSGLAEKYQNKFAENEMDDGLVESCVDNPEMEKYLGSIFLVLAHKIRFITEFKKLGQQEQGEQQKQNEISMTASFNEVNLFCQGEMENPEQLNDREDECLSDASVETEWDEDIEINVMKTSSNSRISPVSAVSKSRKFNEIKNYQELVNIILKNKPENQLSAIFQDCLRFFKFTLSLDQEETLKQKLQSFKNKFNSKWKNHKTTVKNFEKYEATWLQSFIIVPESWFLLKENVDCRKRKRQNSTVQGAEPDRVPGQKKRFVDLTIRGQQKGIQKVTQKLLAVPTPVVLKSAQQVLSKRGEKDKSLILKELQKSSESSKNLVFKLKKNDSRMIPYTEDEGLALLLELGLSKSSYKLLQIRGIERGFNLYPSYHLIANAKKQCYPQGMIFEETVAKAPLQALLDQTLDRIFQIKGDFIQAVLKENGESLNFVLSGVYGFDGSSGHSRYNQDFVDKTIKKSDETLFASIFIPLQVVSSSGQLIWENPRPQSFKYCRPIKLEFVKETHDKIVAEKTDLESQIKSLLDSKIVLGDSIVPVKSELKLTCIDGKCLMAITGVTKSSQSCPICGSTPKTFNVLKNLGNSQFQPKPGTLVHGISPLHCWIRLMEFCLKLAYRIPASVYPLKLKVDKKSFEDTKVEIQKKLRLGLGILVDVVKQGAATTNNGNMARKAFENFLEFSKLIGVDTELVKKFYIILLTISSQRQIESKKFGEFCNETFEYYVQKYPWHPMSVTLHKVLVHGAEIVDNSSLSLGSMSEEAAESRNKYYRHDREFHARKMDRISNLMDIYHRALESSDPWISNVFLCNREKFRKHRPISSEILEIVNELMIPPAATQDRESSNSEAFNCTLDNLEVLEDFALEVEAD